MLFTAALDVLYAALPYKLLIRVTAPAKRSDVPEQVDVHHGLPAIQAGVQTAEKPQAQRVYLSGDANA
jgi:hypothetical protein